MQAAGVQDFPSSATFSTARRLANSGLVNEALAIVVVVSRDLDRKDLGGLDCPRHARAVAADRGTGLGNGAWDGNGITSATAEAWNNTDPEARSIGYAVNADLPLGASPPVCEMP